ncbi:MAG: hypothetical protein OEM60_14925 [Gammaproteobacteria bacterium]|nr:hypothetical protein [Gammaproteobacteria bacterium]
MSTSSHFTDRVVIGGWSPLHAGFFHSVFEESARWRRDRLRAEFLQAILSGSDALDRKLCCPLRICGAEITEPGRPMRKTSQLGDGLKEIKRARCQNPRVGGSTEPPSGDRRQRRPQVERSESVPPLATNDPEKDQLPGQTVSCPA